MSFILRVWITMLFLLGLASAVTAHALQPGFLDMESQGEDAWRVTWRVPDVNGNPMPVRPSLPNTCDHRGPGELRFDGTAHVSTWRAICPGGIAGGTVLIEGLENTQTDVLVRFELVPGRVGTLRLTAAKISSPLPMIPTEFDVLVSYVRLGIHHILTGADHLLFVFSLLLLIRGWQRLIGAITAFTLAHSLSLAAATLGWIILPAPPVEAVIALSIMFLAAELARPAGVGLSLAERRPWIMSFGFGLLHGLGFASALVEIGLPEGLSLIHI
jgi:hypothetical protein